MINLIDTYKDLVNYCEKYKDESIKYMINGWLNEYISTYPELRDKCINNYKEEGFDWYKIALKKIFPSVKNNYKMFKQAHKNIIKQYKYVIEKFKNVFSIDIDINIVIYLGLGNGAGWATYYQGLPSVLLGLENIVDLNWVDEDTIYALISHELCHLAHESIRGKNNGIIIMEQKLKHNSDIALWNLYEEGFAQRCEQLIIGKEIYHQKEGHNWHKWCIYNKHKLCQLYLKCIEENKPVKKFYGTWYSIEGYSETGYFLGCEFIKELQHNMNIREIALLDFEKIKQLVTDYLKRNKLIKEEGLS